ncbi:hypothetical protein [Lentibacillus saliphilus]|uniref:hypothetical protein n=1 Tax=Lentibacillus saliphilus TaxID=2737028 RepID=UPI001C30B416|nr:hypothetical protein [Lentibacillus saliphilus]
MQLIHKQERTELENDTSAIKQILIKVSELIEQENVVFSHLLVDEVEVYDNHEAYIKERINEIMAIEIVTKTPSEMIWETMDSIYGYLGRAIPALKNLVDESYDHFNDETWTGIDQLAEGMQWIIQFKAYVEATEEQPDHWQEINQHIVACESGFVPLLEAVQTRDTVLITDILAYEITPAYEGLERVIGESLKNKESMKHVN